MAQIAFIGLGNMGLPMAKNLAKAGHKVNGFDVRPEARAQFVLAGGAEAPSIDAACMAAEVVVSMLPSGKEVREVYLGQGGVLASTPHGALLIDCSTIDVDSARAVAAGAGVNELAMVDAPVLGGVAEAESGTLNFMVGGSPKAFELAKPILAAMGRSFVHAGGAGNGQAVSICNNMILGVSMIVVAESFLLAEKFGVDAQKLFDVVSHASGQCWAMSQYCPVPGPAPNSPANRDYKPGFTATMMLKDLKLAQEAARSLRAVTPLTAGAAALYQGFVEADDGSIDFSGIIRFLRGK
jgi:3-hydroxyisobutyrate dehydrogenase